MTEVAAEVADGLIVHGFTTEKYLHEVTLPAVERGLAKSGRTRKDFQISYPTFVVTGRDEKAFVASRTGVSQQIAFYGSTPAYKPVLDLHGWGALQGELNALSKQGQWQEMGRRINDEVLEAFAVVAEPDQVIAQIKKRFRGAVDRVSVGLDFGAKKSPRELIAELRAV
jgi:probable F420-dependent oxidoreductase